MIYFLYSHLFFKNALTISIALVWLINGLFCKLLNLVPRHQLIVANILGVKHAVALTKIIGLIEVIMAIWVVSGIRSELCASIQIFVVAVMNIIEFVTVPHLLLFGKINMLIAVFFILIVYCNTFILPNFISQ